jgi:ATP-dependent Clp protease ATP-binding subunit ClpB
MNLNNFTINVAGGDSAGIHHCAGQSAAGVESGHLFKALFTEAEEIMNYLLAKLSVNSRGLEQTVDRLILRYPKVTGGEPYLGQSANRSLLRAMNHSKEAGDQFVSVEHLLLGLLDAGDEVAQMLKDSGFNREGTQAAIQELRKGQKVTSQTDENTFDSLNRFAINLNEQARRASSTRLWAG